MNQNELGQLHRRTNSGSGSSFGGGATVRPNHLKSPRLGQIKEHWTSTPVPAHASPTSAAEGASSFSSAVDPSHAHAPPARRPTPPEGLVGSRSHHIGQYNDDANDSSQRLGHGRAASESSIRSRSPGVSPGSTVLRPSSSQQAPELNARATSSAAATPAIRELKPSRTAMGSAGDAQLAHYSLGDCLGRGAFGSVYRGLNWMTGETVAVKQIDLSNIPESELGEIMSEIELLRNLKHPNIVKYKGSEKTTDYLYIILEYCENGSLQHICKKFGKFPEGLVGVYVSQVLEGLCYLHDQGVIHRDIKGANILTNKDGSVKLADFGVATKTGAMNDYAVVGSPYWMAPEVIDQSGATTASDIWSVGCVVIELLEGKPPYSELEPMPALFRIVQDDFPPLPESASPVVKDFLMHCFQKDANLRVSAKKLLRHPWMMNSRRQLQQMRTGGSLKSNGPNVHDEAVKTVQEWNQILKEPPQAMMTLPTDTGGKASAEPLSYIGGFEAKDGTIRVSQRPRKQRPTMRSFPPSQLHMEGAEGTKESRLVSRVGSMAPMPPSAQAPPLAPTNRVTAALSLADPSKARAPQGEGRSDNWDDDFEDGVTTTKIAALGRLKEPEVRRSSLVEAVPTQLKPATTVSHVRGPVWSTHTTSKNPDDYSEAFVDDEDSRISVKLRNFAHSNSDVGRLQGSSSKPLALKLSFDSLRARTPKGTEAPVSPHVTLKLSSPPASRQGSLRSPAQAEDLRQALGRYSEASALENYEDDFDDGLAAADLVLPNVLRLSQPRIPPDHEKEDDVESDPFSELEEVFASSGDMDANVARDHHARMCQYVNELVERLDPSDQELSLIEICDQLDTILTEAPEMKHQFFASHGALSLVQLLEAIRYPEVICRILGVLNLLIFQDPEAQENLCLIGAIPVVMAFTSKRFNHDVRLEAAHFVYAMCSTSSLTLQFVLSCRGLKTLVNLIDEDYNEQRDLVWLGVGCVNSVLELQSPASRNNFCRMLAQQGLLDPLSTALISVSADSGDQYAKQAQVQALQTFLIYSQSDSWMKQQLASRSVLRRILKSTQSLDSLSLVTAVRIIKNLSMHPQIMDQLQNCNSIEVLTRILSDHHGGPCGNEISNQVLNAIYNLCRLSKSRQEEAAQAGIIPQLLRVARTNSPMRQFALPTLCDFAHASKATRKIFWQHDGLRFYLQLLEDVYWQVPALDSVLVWLQDETSRVEGVLLQPTSVASLSNCFSSSKGVSFENLLEPFVKICRISSGIAVALARFASFFQRIADRLHHKKAIVRLNLLRITKILCDVHPDRSAVLSNGGLSDIIKSLSKEDSAVLVRELARDIVTTPAAAPSRGLRPPEKGDAQSRRSMSETCAGPAVAIHNGDVHLQRVSGSGNGNGVVRRPIPDWAAASTRTAVLQQYSSSSSASAVSPSSPSPRRVPSSQALLAPRSSSRRALYESLQERNDPG
ncbi:hypothetical protein K437DRAFT_255295 [Tilletiaria anomala UBC 951]|uniref:Protein kinase domain-containing protein n=1 Tax=Tilletiaria anomala (strain ATCC 24038 / CBS 436.72 / UBC 951) TaxID=1037660 RepID=A0A066W6K3_TILAU|nr:uncharacterized protein K437DRAFT_255295 [Tilletiaria anomala UBC 951]KDN49612.1 hypothetical protein K437DRAFT_255295 [Tilletiaria anomala UBC 951]